MWKRRIERAKELRLIIPDPAVLLSALDTITEKVIKKDLQRSFCVESAREGIKVDVATTKEAVDQLPMILEGELEQGVSSKWTTIAPKVKIIKGNPKGKRKDGKGKDGEGKDGKGKDGKGKDKGKEPCYFLQKRKEDAIKDNAVRGITVY